MGWLKDRRTNKAAREAAALEELELLLCGAPTPICDLAAGLDPEDRVQEVEVWLPQVLAERALPATQDQVMLLLSAPVAEPDPTVSPNWVARRGEWYRAIPEDVLAAIRSWPPEEPLRVWVIPFATMFDQAATIVRGPARS